MKELTEIRYQCERCEAIYEDRLQALKCENSHCELEEIISTTYVRNLDCPKYIYMQSTDGEVFIYEITYKED